MSEQGFETMRRAMVASQLRTTAVNDPRVVAAMAAVPRERFVPADRTAIAYADIAVPLGNGRALSPPMAVGKMLSELHPRPQDRALVIGAATGYSAAVLARLVGSVVALEEDGTLAAPGAADGVRFVRGPLAEGWAADAPYDLILIDGAVEQVPEAIVDQLAEGGRLAAAILEAGVSRLSIGRRAGGFGLAAFADADAAPLPGFAPPAVFRF